MHFANDHISPVKDRHVNLNWVTERCVLIFQAGPNSVHVPAIDRDFNRLFD